MAKLFTKAATINALASTGMTTLALARNPRIRAALSTPILNQTVEKLLKEKIATLSDKIKSALKGVNNLEERQKKLKDLAGKENALTDGSLRLLESSEYFALMSTTPHPEAHRGETWNRDKILIHDVDELSEMIDEGANFLHANEVNPKLSTVVTAMPAAGMAARASDELLKRPDLLGLLKLHKAMEGLPDEVFPPRFMYPVRTRLSSKEIETMTLLSLMLQSSRTISKGAGAKIGSILMLHPNMVNYVLGKIEKELKLDDEEAESIALFPQPLSVKFKVGAEKYTPPEFPAGHGDLPLLMAQAQIYNFLMEQGIQRIFYANADEIVYAPNSVLVAASNKLIDKGYSAIVFVVANTNGQKGGGPFKDKSGGNVLREIPTLPQDINEELSWRERGWREMLAGKLDPQFVKPLPPINTLSLVLSVPAFARISDQLKTVNPGLDVKSAGDDFLLGMESWSGTELTLPATQFEDFKVAFVFVERTGFFTGIKIPNHVYGNFQGEEGSVPPELWNLPKSSPFAPFSNMTYFQYIQYLAENYQKILKGMFAKDEKLIERLFRAGGGYLVQI